MSINYRGEGAHSNGPYLNSFGGVVIEINLVKDSCRFLVRNLMLRTTKAAEVPQTKNWILTLRPCRLRSNVSLQFLVWVSEVT